MSIYKMRTEFGKYLKPILFLIALIFLIGAIWSFGVAPTRQGPGASGKGGAIAKVNGVEIDRNEFESMWDTTVEQARQQGIRSPLQYADMRAGAFEQMVNNISMLQVAKQMGVDVSDKRVNAEIDKAVTAYLKQNREAVLGKLSKEEESVDPRKDSRYKQELATIDSSLAMQEEFAKSRIPANQVRAQIAREGILEKLKAGTKSITDADVKASYDVYKIRAIFLPTGSLPKEQLTTKASKIESAAKAGEDFVKLARENASPKDKSPGSQIEYSFQTSFGYPPELSRAISKMKAGEISPVIDTAQGLFIIKVDSITSKMPAKLDKKARDQRRNDIAQMRQAMAASAVQQQLTKSRKVEVLDPEFLGYWDLSQAQRATSLAERKKLMNMAIAALLRAKGERPNNFVAIAKLVQLQYEQGQTEQAIRILYPMLEGQNATQEGADLRMLLGDMLLKKGDKTRAIDQYKQASEVAMNDKAIHQQLITKFQQLGRPDLVSAEQKWIVDYDQRLKDFGEMMKKNPNARRMPGPTPARPKE